MIHFTSKAFLIYETRQFQYGASVSVCGVFNTRKRAIAAMEALQKQCKLEYPRYDGDLKIVEVSVNSSPAVNSLPEIYSWEE
jgi:hypothetical protein